jgi:hypothetical protein
MRKWKPGEAIWAFNYAAMSLAMIAGALGGNLGANPPLALVLALALLLGPPAALYPYLRARPRLKPSHVTQALIAIIYWFAVVFVVFVLAMARHADLPALAVPAVFSALLALGFFFSFRLREKAARLFGAPFTLIFAWSLAMGLLRLCILGAENGLLWYLLPLGAAALLLVWWRRRRRG